MAMSFINQSGWHVVRSAVDLCSGSWLMMSQLYSNGDCVFGSILLKERLTVQGALGSGLQAWSQRIKEWFGGLQHADSDQPELGDPHIGHACTELRRMESF